MNEDKQKLHYRISMVKSALRLVGYGLIVIAPWTAVAILVISEVFGIAEEIWGA